MTQEELFKLIKDCAYEVRLHLKAGYLENVYKNALAYELMNAGLKVAMEVAIPVYYKGVNVGDYRADIVVESSVILEIKAVSTLLPIHEVQLVNYLVSTGVDYGFLINYGGKDFRIIRKSRIYQPSPKI